MELRNYRRLRLPAKPFVSLAYSGSNMDFGIMAIMSQAQMDSYLEKYKDMDDNFQIYEDHLIDEFLEENLGQIDPLIASYVLKKDGNIRKKIWKDFTRKYNLPENRAVSGIGDSYTDHFGVGVFINLYFNIPFGVKHSFNINANHQYLLSAAFQLDWAVNKRNYFGIKKVSGLKYLPLMITGYYLRYMPVPTPEGINALLSALPGVDSVLGDLGWYDCTILLQRIQLMCKLIDECETIKKDKYYSCVSYLSALNDVWANISTDIIKSFGNADYQLGWLQNTVSDQMDAVNFHDATRLDGEYIKVKK